MSSWGQRCGCRNHTANTNVGCPYNVKSGVCDDCEKYCTVRDERSEESAVQAERTRIIKALEGLETLRPPVSIHYGSDENFNNRPAYIDKDQAIKAIKE